MRIRTVDFKFDDGNQLGDSMHSIVSGTSAATFMDRTIISEAPIRYCRLPLQLDVDTGNLLRNDHNKMILDDLRTALALDATSAGDIDAIFHNACVNNYTHILKVILQGLPRYSSTITHDHLERVELNEQPAQQMAPPLEPITTGDASPSKPVSSGFKFPTKLKRFRLAKMKRYDPKFYAAFAKQKFARKVAIACAKNDLPGSNHFDPGTKVLTLSADHRTPKSVALGPIVHEMSHARDFMALNHAGIDRGAQRSQYSGTVPAGVLTKAEELFTTELKAWLVEAMQLCLVDRAGGELTRSQRMLIEGFRAGYDNIVNGAFNYVASRIVVYLDQLPEPKPTIKQIFAEGDSPLENALQEGVLLFRQFLLAVEERQEIDANLYIKKLDSIFHTELYRVEEPGSQKHADLVTFRSLMDGPQRQK